MQNGSPRDIAAGLGGDAERAAALMRLMMGGHDADSDHPWHRLERGEITMDECRAAQRELFAAEGITLPSLGGGSGGGFRFVLNEPVIELVADLRAAGLRTGILTNNIRDARALWWDLHPWTDVFDDIVDSHEVGLRKPDPAIYHLALERLGATAERTAFCDDIAANVDAAGRLGIHGVLVEADPMPAVTAVRRLAGLA